MMVLITYDVETITREGRRRLRKVAKECENYGQRVQNSVFECNIDPALFASLKFSLISLIDKEKDSLRFYYLGNNWKNRVDHEGKETSYDVEGTLII